MVQQKQDQQGTWAAGTQRGIDRLRVSEHGKKKQREKGGQR